MTIYAMLANGFEEIEAIAFIDILRRAKIDIKTVSVYNTKTVTGAHGISLNADYTLDSLAAEDGDGIFLPGGMPGTTNLFENEFLKDLLIEYNSKGKYLISICAAPMIFGKLKLLEGKQATCYPSFEKYLLGATHVEDDVCVDGNILTSRGAGTAHKLGFKFVEIIKGYEYSYDLMKSMQYK